MYRMDTPKIQGEVLRLFRDREKWTQLDLADALEIDRGKIGKLENGRSVQDDGLLDRCIESLGLSKSHFYAMCAAIRRCDEEFGGVAAARAGGEEIRDVSPPGSGYRTDGAAGHGLAAGRQLRISVDVNCGASTPLRYSVKEEDE